MAAARSEHLYSASPVTLEQSVCRAWRLWGRAADLLSSEQERPCCPGPGLCLSRGRPNPRLCPDPVLPDLHSWILAPGRVGTSPRSRHSPSELLLEPRSPLHMKPLPLP